MFAGDEPKMDAIGDELATVATVSTESPSPIPAPRHARDLSAASRHYFRLSSMSSLTAPVSEQKAAHLALTRSARLPENCRPYLSSSGGVCSFGSEPGEGRGGVEEEKLPFPDNPTAWARYGFLDQSLLLQATGQSAGGRRAASLPGGEPSEEGTVGFGDASRSLVRVGTDPGEGLGGERRHPPATAIAETTAAETHSSRPGAEESLSLDVGFSTPPTDILTPSSEERLRKGHAAPAARNVGSSSSSSNGPATATRNIISSSRGGLDSMAASMLASSAALAAAAAAKQEEETKEEELAALRQQEARQATMASVAEAQGNGGSGSGPSSLRTPQTIAEMERHKRNRAERLRAYGCQR